MKPWLKWTLGIVAGLILLLFVGFQFLKMQTKKHSPEQTITYTENGMDILVFYNRPYKKGREIFGDLVSYGETWRTGANEATTFDTNTDLFIEGQALPAGHYTLWTVPGRDNWQIVWNTKDYPWGVSFGEKASRDPGFDALMVEVPAETLPQVVEQFTIRFEDNQMLLEWDRTRVAVDIEKG